MNRIPYLQAKADILQAGLDAYHQAHPDQTKEEKQMVDELTCERINLSNMVDSLIENRQTKTLKEWIDTYLRLGNVEDAMVVIQKSDGTHAAGIDGSLHIVKDMLSPEWLSRTAYVAVIDEDDSFVKLTIELDD